MKLEALRREDMPKLLEWRNMHPEAWRDPRPTTITQQYEWFDGPVSHNPNGRYWGVHKEVNIGEVRLEPIFDLDPGGLIAQSEITSIIWESRIGEIGIMVDPNRRRKGLGKELLSATLQMAFSRLNLATIWGECYECNDACNFWLKYVKEWNGYSTILKNRKYWNSKFYDSLYFSWDIENVSKYIAG